MKDSSDSIQKDEEIIIRVNPKLYPLEAVYSAAYVFMDRAYIVLDGDPEKEILVKMKIKSGCSSEKIEGEFNNELLNYADYLARAKNTKEIREMFLKRAIITNDPGMIQPQENAESEENADFEDSDDLDDDFLDDPEGIAIPWEEKYGDKSNKEESPQENGDKSKQ